MKIGKLKYVWVQSAVIAVAMMIPAVCNAADSQKVSVPVEVWRDVSTRELTIAGIGKAKDGDTLSIDGVFDVRLIGIDAVEKRQTCDVNEEIWRCGEDARAYLASLVDGQKVSCENKKKEKYGRFLSVCKVGDIELNKEMVVRGFAVAHLAPDYVDDEEIARENHVGIWAGTFKQPDKWRKKHK